MTASSGSAPGGTATSTAAAPGGSTYTVAQWGQFTTPSGNNWCDMSQRDVGCSLTSALSAQHGGAGYITLNDKGFMYLTGDPGIDFDGSAGSWITTVPGAKPTKKNGTTVLPYGSSISNGPVTCTSNPAGVMCKNAAASFTVNTNAVTTTGKKAPPQH